MKKKEKKKRKGTHPPPLDFAIDISAHECHFNEFIYKIKMAQSYVQRFVTLIKKKKKPKKKKEKRGLLLAHNQPTQKKKQTSFWVRLSVS
jgi:hypothetical protein